MSTDRYTKAVLTVIAGALLYIGAMLSGQPAAAQGALTVTTPSFMAQTKPQPVVVVGWGSVRSDGEIFVQMAREGSIVRTESAIPVNVQASPQRPLAVTLGVSDSRPLPVSLNSVRPAGVWEPVRVKVEPGPLTPRPGPQVP
jgi:Ni,Fe-hydrogenase III small subunit